MDGTGVFELKLSLLAGSLAVVMVGVQANAGQQTVAQAIPDAPRPQTNLPLAGVTPGEGTTSSATDTDSSSSPSAPTSRPADATPTVTSGMPTESDQSPVVTPLPGQGAAAFSSITLPSTMSTFPLRLRIRRGSCSPG
jgi:cytoskeletal protein RodZ